MRDGRGSVAVGGLCGLGDLAISNCAAAIAGISSRHSARELRILPRRNPPIKIPSEQTKRSPASVWASTK